MAAATVVLFVTATLAQQPKQPTFKGQPVPDAGQQQRAQDGKEHAPKKDQGGAELLPAIQGIEAAIRDHVAKEDKSESERKEKREIDDLKAQQEMALWAKRMSWAAFAGLFLTFAGLTLTGIGLVLLYYTLGYTRDAAIAANASVVQARRAAEAAEATNVLVAQNAALEVRAYLSVRPAGINELIGTQLAMGHVDVRNVGRLPAREVWLHVRMRIGDRDDLKSGLSRGPDDYEVPGDPYDNPGFNVDRAIQPGTQMRQGAAEDDTIPVAALLAQRDRYVYVWGVAWYSDGRKRRFTKFRHRYAIASHVSGPDWNQPARETRRIITVDKARFHPYGNSAN